MLKAELAGVKLSNPTILASGIMGVSGASLSFAAKNGAGAVTSKSISLEPRKGHPNPVILTYGQGMLNAVGLSNAGIKDSLPEIEYAVKNAGVPVIASLVEFKAENFGPLAKEISKANPALIEINLSCPNVESEFGKPFSHDPAAAEWATRAAKRNTKIPVFVKLSPNAPDLVEVARAVKSAGADGITAINTAGPGMQIDIFARRPVLSNRCGGVSGPAIKPIAVKCIYDIYKETKLPIIGTGGATTGADAVEFIMAGASAVGIGSGIYYRGINIFQKVCKEMQEFMDKEGFSSVKDMRGIAHEQGTGGGACQ
jgi:dihydroorotate dehydrogenase (NAD+) catalytic subunit